jgi:hypothetical protein
MKPTAIATEPLQVKRNSRCRPRARKLLEWLWGRPAPLDEDGNWATCVGRIAETPVATTVPQSLNERSDPDERVTHLSAAYGLALGLDAMVGQLVPLVRLPLP